MSNDVEHLQAHIREMATLLGKKNAEVERLRAIFSPGLLWAAFQALSYIARHVPESQFDECAKRATDFDKAVNAYQKQEKDT